jgi:hypothetical protein
MTNGFTTRFYTSQAHLKGACEFSGVTSTKHAKKLCMSIAFIEARTKMQVPLTIDVIVAQTTTSKPIESLQSA